MLKEKNKLISNKLKFYKNKQKIKWARKLNKQNKSKQIWNKNRFKNKMIN